jgi:hypothetical protein
MNREGRPRQAGALPFAGPPTESLPQQLQCLLLRRVGLRQHRLCCLAWRLRLGQLGRFRRESGIDDPRP